MGRNRQDSHIFRSTAATIREQIVQPSAPLQQASCGTDRSETRSGRCHHNTRVPANFSRGQEFLRQHPWRKLEGQSMESSRACAFLTTPFSGWASLPSPQVFVFNLGVVIKMGNITLHPIYLAVMGHATNSDCFLLTARRGQGSSFKWTDFCRNIRPCKTRRGSCVWYSLFLLVVPYSKRSHNSLQRGHQSLFNVKQKKETTFLKVRERAGITAQCQVLCSTIRYQAGPLSWSCRGTLSYLQCKARCQSWILGTPGRPLFFPRAEKLSVYTHYNQS